MNFMLLNPWSLVNKIDAVMVEIVDNKVDFAGICETWLQDDNCPTTAVIKSYGYNVHHTIRANGKKGGGTALIFRNGFACTPFKCQTNFKSFEYTACSTKTSTGTNITYIVIYRPGQISSTFISEIDELLSFVLPKCDILIVAGDLNIHFDDPSNKLYSQAFKIFQSYGLQRKVFLPTHIAGKSLDQIFTFSLEKDQLQCAVSVDAASAIQSDHYPVYCKFSLSFERKYFKEVSFRRLSEIDEQLFHTDLVTILQNVSTQSFSCALSYLRSSFSSLLTHHAPILTKRISCVDTAPWFDAEYREQRKTRRKLERIAKKDSATIDDKIAYKQACVDCTLLARTKKKETFSRMIEKSGNNPKSLYKLVNKALDRKQEKSLPDYTLDMNQLATDFNNFFVDKIEKIRSEMNLTPDVSFESESSDIPQMSLMHEFSPTSVDEIKEIIAESGLKCSPADLLPQSLLKKNIDFLLPLLVDLVNLSLKSGDVNGVKEADIIPLLKGNGLDPNVLKNFRPVSNLLFLGKLIERVVLRRLNEHMSRNNLHTPEQSAYKRHHSTETILVRITNDLLIASEGRTASVVMLLDLSAAFDTVDHNLLLKILSKEIGLRGTVLEWFTSFLKGRSQRIRLGKVLSEDIVIRFGVPQGSVLGPVLFNIYIRSIYGCVQKLNFNIHGYADDHQIMKSFHPSQQNSVLIHDIQTCFTMVRKWMNQYFLKMNDSKTQVIVFGPPRVLDAIDIGGANFDEGTSIRFISSVKNLGIYMDSTLSMDIQIIELKKKCFRVLRNIRKIRYLLNENQVKQIVNSLVVSCLDYCNSLFYGISGKLTHQLQLIQNACSKAITKKYKHDHLEDDLKSLHWLDIRRRVLFKIALLAYKSVNGFAPEYLQELFSYSHHGHALKLMTPHYKLEKYGRRSFSSIGPRLFNALPERVKSAPSIVRFKSHLKTFLFGLSDYDLDHLL